MSYSAVFDEDIDSEQIITSSLSIFSDSQQYFILKPLQSSIHLRLCLPVDLFPPVHLSCMASLSKQLDSAWHVHYNLASASQSNNCLSSTMRSKADSFRSVFFKYSHLHIYTGIWFGSGSTLLFISHITSSYHIVELKRQNRLKHGTDKPKPKVKMQSVSDDDVRKTSWKPHFYLAAKGVFKLGRCYIFQQGVPGFWASNPESTATNGWSLDLWHQKRVGACRTKRLCLVAVITKLLYTRPDYYLDG